MTDITKCTGQGCPLRSKCHRFKVKAGEYQSYFEKPPYEKETNECKYFWPYEK
jgi:hypothetical protein